MGEIAQIVAVDDDREMTTEARVIDAAFACIARFGLTKTTLDDVVRESGISRATIYRAFPGGRERLFDAVVESEVARFFDEVEAAIATSLSFEDLVVSGLQAAMGFLAGNDALRTILELEPGLVLPRFAFHRLDRVMAQISAALDETLTPYVGDDAGVLAEHLVRIVLTYAMSPSARIDPGDPESIRRLVRLHVLPGFVPAAVLTP